MQSEHNITIVVQPNNINSCADATV